MVWATVADVTAITGVVPSQVQVDRAIIQIELEVGRLQVNLPNPTGRDAYFLKLAVAYQAAKIVEDAAAESDVSSLISSLSIDGLSVGVKASTTPDTTSNSALAARAVSRLSWMRSGSKSVGLAGLANSPEYVHDDVEDDEGVHWRQWRPI